MRGNASGSAGRLFRWPLAACVSAVIIGASGCGEDLSYHQSVIKDFCEEGSGDTTPETCRMQLESYVAGCRSQLKASELDNNGCLEKALESW